MHKTSDAFASFTAPFMRCWTRQHAASDDPADCDPEPNVREVAAEELGLGPDGPRGRRSGSVMLNFLLFCKVGNSKHKVVGFVAPVAVIIGHHSG